MAIRSMGSRSFAGRLFLTVGGVFVLFAVCFSIYQYHRERQFKTDIIDARLQAYCYEMMQSLGPDSILSRQAFFRYLASHNIEGLRITVVDVEGKVLLDSNEPPIDLLENHSGRKEIAEALRYGKGYDIKRTSASTHETYFYSATRFGDLVLRAAVPYSAELTRSLQADNTYLYFALALTLLLGLVLYFNTSRIGRHIEYLRQFAQKAERGEELDYELERRLPDDELGDISHTIIALYWQLRHSEDDKARLKRQLTQNAAHELKTPAASIHGYLESIIEHPDMDEQQRRHFLERCYAQSERMSHLLQDMATLTRLDESPRLNAEPLDVVEIIDSVLSDVSYELEQRGIEPVLCLPEKISVVGDRSLLYSVVRNIVDNAIAYATDATRLSILCAECEDESHDRLYYEFTISDNGAGVDAVHLPHLFERFYRVDKGRSRQSGGTGLGLAIVKNAVAAHGGTVSAEATPGGGLTIRFTLNHKGAS